MASVRKHIVLVAPPFFGHALPLLHLAHKLSRFHRITFAVSEAILENIRIEISNIPQAIHLIGVRQEATKLTDKPRNMGEVLRDILDQCLPGLREFFQTLVRNTPENAALNFNQDSRLDMKNALLDA